MFISVITVNKNNLIGLEKTINSLLNQSFKSFEWIFVDGLSSDGSIKFSEKVILPNKIIISEHDDGIYDAMNKGIKNAKGEYVIFMNSGDMFASSDTLERFYYFTQSNKCDMYIGDTYERRKRLVLKKSKQISAIEFGMPCHHQSIIYRNIDLHYPTCYKFASDYYLTARIYLLKKKIAKLNFAISIFDTEGVSSKKINTSFKEMALIRKILFNKNYTIVDVIINYIKVKIKYIYYWFI